MNFLAKVTDWSFSFLANNFLSVDPEAFNTTGPTYKVWSTMRNIANILFVIVFLVIMYSQLTGTGVSNYGIKKLLPRLVVGAVLVNLSYFICQLAIDLSNLLGYSLKSLFDGFGASLEIGADQTLQAGGADGTFGVIVGGVLAGAALGGALYLFIGTLAPVLIASLVALLMILFILLARQALVVLLVVISPIAFVAFLLPNTQSLFKRWQKLFTAVLLVFPIISVVFGASTLASVVITATNNGSGVTSPDAQNWWGSIIGAAIAILPLFIVPGILKKSLDGVGGIGAKINGIGSKLSGLASNKTKSSPRLKQFEAARDSRKSLRYARRRMGEGRIAKLGEGISGDENAGVLRKRIGGVVTGAGRLGSRFDQTKVGTFLGQNKGAIQAQAAIQRDLEESIKDADLSFNGRTMEDIADIASGKQPASDSERIAAIRRVMSSGSFGQKKAALAGAVGASKEVKTALSTGYYAGGMQNYYGTNGGDRILDNKDVTTNESLRENFGNIPSAIFKSTPKGIDAITAAAIDPSTTEKDKEALRTALANFEKSSDNIGNMTADQTESLNMLKAAIGYTASGSTDSTTTLEVPHDSTSSQQQTASTGTRQASQGSTPAADSGTTPPAATPASSAPRSASTSASSSTSPIVPPRTAPTENRTGQSPQTPNSDAGD